MVPNLICLSYYYNSFHDHKNVLTIDLITSVLSELHPYNLQSIFSINKHWYVK